ncbi:MAG TPA: hypothetical protein VMV51_05825 [Gemmatimonadaceae bacterium]|nr:hypothetical protein [Gemmatimonadaceae bacterium]
MSRSVHRITFLLAGAAVMVALGCRDANPAASVVAPAALSRAGTPNHDSAPSPGESTDDNAHLLACDAHASATASAMVGPAGGTITVGNDRLVIPGGALSDSVLITATIPADTLASIQFAPHGLQFAKGVMLLLSTAGCAVGGQTPGHVVYLDGTGDVLETLDAMFNAQAGTVVTHIEHFSSYAIAF